MKTGHCESGTLKNYTHACIRKHMPGCNFREIDILALILDCFAIAAYSCGAADEVSDVKLVVFF